VIPAGIRTAVMGRDGGQCARCGAPATNVHHRQPRGMGGSNDPTINDSSNLVSLCGSGTTGCHGWIEANRLAAMTRGWLVPRRSGLTPAETPIYRGGQWWWLSDTWTLADKAWEVPF